ncbi:unnamed protein product [Amoebophrya sp. A25]|nr:unnamed protein product [Amoebophrya sp. A25]|eukprot:GSA25T00016892001.1
MISAYDGVSNMEIFGLPKYLEEDRQVKNPFFTGETANALYNFLRGGLRCHPDDRENIRGLIRLFNVLIDTYANNKEENHADDPARKEQILALKIPEDKLKKPTGSQQAINEKTKATMRKAVEEYQKARTDVENLSAEVKLEEARTAMKGAVSHELPVKTTAFNTAVKKVEDQVYKKGMEILYNIVRRSELGEGAGDGGGV